MTHRTYDKQFKIVIVNFVLESKMSVLELSKELFIYLSYYVHVPYQFCSR